MSRTEPESGETGAVHPPESDSLSDAARALLQVGTYDWLVVDSAPRDEDLRRRLAALSAENVLKRPARSRDEANALVAGIWLWHDFLDESHTISQGIGSATGSFWHAIMHRREGDFSNAKYWYARCRRHPVLEELSVHSDALVDLVQHVYKKPDDPRHAEAVRLQRAEWRALFAYSVRAATA